MNRFKKNFKHKIFLIADDRGRDFGIIVCKNAPQERRNQSEVELHWPSVSKIHIFESVTKKLGKKCILIKKKSCCKGNLSIKNGIIKINLCIYNFKNSIFGTSYMFTAKL